MPIEIKELHIRVNVTPPGSGQGGGNPSAAPGTGGKPSGKESQDLIAECVERVMEILENKKER
jgi:hypothetical protein